MQPMPAEERTPNPEAQLASFFAKYEPAIAKLGKALRTRLRTRLPGLLELVYVYENQESLVISYSPTDSGHEGVCAIAVYPTGVKLFFGRGAQLSKADPSKLLQGSAKLVRFVGIDAIADFERAEVEVLIAAAVKLAKVRIVAGAEGAVVIKAAAQKERARRAKKVGKKVGKVAVGRAKKAKG